MNLGVFVVGIIIVIVILIGIKDNNRKENNINKEPKIDKQSSNSRVNELSENNNLKLQDDKQQGGKLRNSSIDREGLYSFETLLSNGEEYEKIKMLFFDTETTGLKPGNICQLSYILFDGEATQAKNFFFTVDHVEPGAERIHGLSVERLNILSGNKRFRDCYDEIRDDFNNANVIAAHNFNFDINFIKTEFSRCNYKYNYDESFCTMQYFTPICKIPYSEYSKKTGYKWPKLEELADFLGLRNDHILETCEEMFKCNNIGFHDSRFDVVATYLCYIKAMNKGLIKKV
ncbi:3'-5' exonuclease [Tissierella sp.]|uniref:3'-5' exonuclease n=1 Tax=Tissierella sp. TaxID=41274 RepID=UPI00301F2C30